jgi:hypothetical protein
VGAFCNLAASFTASRLDECFHEADQETLPRFASQHWFVNIDGKLASNPISSSNHPVFPFPVSSGDAIDCDGPQARILRKTQATGICRPRGGKLARNSRLTRGKLEENPDFSLRRVTFR